VTDTEQRLPVALGIIGGRGSDVMLAELIAEFEKMSSGEKAGTPEGFENEHHHQEIMDSNLEL